MSHRSTIAIATVAGLTLTAGVHAGVVNYSIHSNMTEASLGDTVSLRVEADIDPQGGQFFALGAAAFSIITTDIPSGGAIDFTSPGLGLDPEFALGSPGTLVDDDIMNIQASQLPGFLNPNINTDLNVTLYRFEFTVVDGTPRTVTFDLTGLFNSVYSSQNSGVGPIFTSSASTPLQLEVTSVPAPGAAALLLSAGLFTRRRRRS